MVHSESGTTKSKGFTADDAKYLMSGAVAGAVSRTVAAPFERLKIVFQVQDMASRTAQGAEAQKYTGIWQATKRIYAEEGVWGYFKGNGTNVVRIIPYMSSQFYSYEVYKGWFTEENKPLSTPRRLLAGSMAGITSVVVSYPLDLVRCRLSVSESREQYKGICDALVKVYQKEGMFGLYKGMIPTLFGIAPYVGFNFTIYEWLKKRAPKPEGSDSPSVSTKLVLGAISGTTAQTITYPFDTLRRRMQMQGFTDPHEKHRGMIENTKIIFQQKGYKGFYKGLISNYLKVVPTVSVSFVVYEFMKKALNMKSKAGEM